MNNGGKGASLWEISRVDMCRLAPLCDVGAAIRAAPVAHGAQAGTVSPIPEGPISPADETLKQIKEFEDPALRYQALKYPEEPTPMLCGNLLKLQPALNAYGGGSCTLFFAWVFDILGYRGVISRHVFDILSQ